MAFSPIFFALCVFSAAAIITLASAPKPKPTPPAALCSVNETVEIDGTRYEDDWSPPLMVPCRWLKLEQDI